MPETRKYKIIVLINAIEGKEDQLNDWFTNVHMPDALKIPGFVSGQRFKLTPEQREGADPKWKFLALYELETDDLQGLIDEMKRRAGTPLMVGTDTIAPGGFVNFFEPITELMAP